MSHLGEEELKKRRICVSFQGELLIETANTD